MKEGNLKINPLINSTFVKNEISKIPAVVLNTSSDKPEAEKFIKFLAGEKSREILKKHNYKTFIESKK